MRALIIGDTHYENWAPGYLESQIESTKRLVRENPSDAVFFLGDIFHHRKPSPETIVAVMAMFRDLKDKNIIILRGNHDSLSKSDDGVTILDALTYSSSNVRIVKHFEYDKKLNILFAPHYENENLVSEFLSEFNVTNSLVLGHFGFIGCVPTKESYTFTIDKSLLAKFDKVILGHIHRYSEHGNITILGTPWSTNFGESNYGHFVATIDFDSNLGRWSDPKKIEVNFGPRFYAIPMEGVDSMREDISDSRFFTLLRVFMDKVNDSSTNDTRATIKKDLNVQFVDLKFQPVYDKKLNNRLSNYDPQSALTDLSDNIVEKYLEEQVSTIPTDILRKGLELISSHANSKDISK